MEISSGLLFDVVDESSVVEFSDNKYDFDDVLMVLRMFPEKERIGLLFLRRALSVVVNGICFLVILLVVLCLLIGISFIRL